MAGIETDVGSGQIRRGEERAAGGHFVFLHDGDGGVGFLRDEADEFAVEGQRWRKLVVVRLQPSVAGSFLQVSEYRRGNSAAA